MTEEKTTKEKVDERFAQLPTKIKNAITNPGWENEIRRIVDKYKLRVDQGNILENQTLFLMLGLQDLDGFFQILGDNIDNEDNKLENILDDIEASVLSKIKHMIMNNEVEEKQDPKYSLMKEDRNQSVKDDEILTVTRDEILKDIEDPQVPLSGQNINLPPLKQSFVMPKVNINEELKTKLDIMYANKDKVKTQSENIIPIKSAPSNTTETKVFPSVQSIPETKVEIREEQIPNNLPVKNLVTNKTIDPVEAVMNNRVTTTNKPTPDPYREPIE